MNFKFDKKANEKFKFNQNAARTILKKMDTDHDNVIDEGEFCTYFAHLTEGLSEKDFDKVFQSVFFFLWYCSLY